MTSARSSVPPFHAMEMAGLATAREATGASVIHLEVGQPWSPAPAARARRGGAGARARPDRVHQRQRPALAAQADRWALPGLVRRRARSCRPGDHRRRLGRVHPRLPGLLRPGRPRRCRRARLPLLPEHAARARGRARRHRRRARVPLGADARAARPRRTARRAGRRQPLEPDRHGPRPRAAGRGGRLVPRPRRPADLRRDLPRHHLRAAGRERAGAVERCRRGVQLLQVLLDDRLATGLDHRAARRDGGRRAVPAEPLHLRAGALPARRRRRLRLRGGARRARGPLRPQPPGAARGPGLRRPDRPRRGRRRVLRLRRRLPPDRRLPPAVPPLAGGDRRHDRAGDRLRPGARPPVRPVLLLRPRRRHRRRLPAPRGMAASARLAAGP